MLSWGCSAAGVWELSFVLFFRCFHFLTKDLVPNAYKYLSASGIFSLLPSGSSNATTREEVEPDLYEVGGRTQLGFCMTNRVAYEGLAATSAWWHSSGLCGPWSL